MTNLELIAQVNALCDNQVEDTHKMKWLDTLDQTVDRELHAAFRADFPEFTPTSGTRSLLVAAPYDEMYAPYIETMIHCTTGELTRYNNALSRFQSAYKAYGDYVCRTHSTASSAWKLY